MNLNPIKSHTPTPWQADKCKTRQGYTIAQTPTREHPAVLANIAQVVDGPESEANAAFIVRAVNAYEPMLEALKAALLRIDTDVAENPAAKTNRPEISVKIRNAIAKAEGRE